MASNQHIPYDSFYKPKDKVMPLPEFWYHILTPNKKEYTEYSVQPFGITSTGRFAFLPLQDIFRKQEKPPRSRSTD